FKYGHIQISESARLNHSLVGPTVATPVFLLDQGFHRPEPGRITIWEDPTMPYPDWSPLKSWNNLLLQFQVIAWNVPVVLTMLTGLTLAFPLLAAYGLWQCTGAARRKVAIEGGLTTGAAAVPIAMMSLLFLPNYLLVTEQRYFYPVFALLFVA